MTNEVDTEQPMRDELEDELATLKAIRELLLPDADDSYILSELVTLETQIRAAEQALNE